MITRSPNTTKRLSNIKQRLDGNNFYGENGERMETILVGQNLLEIGHCAKNSVTSPFTVYGYVQGTV